MEGKKGKITLTLSQFENALTIVNKEKLTKLYTRRHKIALHIGIVSACVIILCYIIGFIYTPLLSKIDILIAFFSIILVISTLLNLPLMAKLFRYYYRIKRLGLAKVLIAPWRKERNKTKALNILDGLITVFGFVIILPMIIMGFYALREEGGIMLIPVILMGFAIGLSFISFRYIRLNLSRLKVINRLQKSLLLYKNEIGEFNIQEVTIPLEDYELITQIERTQIIRDQAKSIKEHRDDLNSSNYTIQMSRGFKKARASLNQMSRLAVQDQIDELLNQYNSNRSSDQPYTEIIHMEIPDQSILLEYQVDVERKNIKLIDIVSKESKKPGM